jgi:pyruvate kinase
MDHSKKKTFHQLTKAKVIRQLRRILMEMKQAERNFSSELSSLHEHFKWSGANLIHYLVLRSNEIRELQEYLHHVGLSSMTNSESHTFTQLQNVLGWLQNKELKPHPTSCTF